MSTPFLTQFAQSMVDRLLSEQLVEIELGSRPNVVVHVAAHLGGVGSGGSLISEMDRALLTCDDVVELYADAEQLKELVVDLRG